MKICIESLDGKTRSFVVRGSIKLGDLRNIIYEKMGIAPHHQRLVFAGAILRKEFQSLTHYNMKCGSTVYLGDRRNDKRTRPATQTTPGPSTPTTKRSRHTTKTSPSSSSSPSPSSTPSSSSAPSSTPSSSHPSSPSPNSFSIFDTNDGEVCAKYIQGLATPLDRQAICNKNYEAKLKVFALHQAKATVALSDLMPEIQSRLPASVLTELEDLKRENGSLRTKEKELNATITTLTHKNKELSARSATVLSNETGLKETISGLTQKNKNLSAQCATALNTEKGLKGTISNLTQQNKELSTQCATVLSNEKGLKDTVSSLTHKNRMFSTRFASYESQLIALETENKKIKEELMAADKKYLGAKVAGYTEGLNEGKTKWLESLELFDHLTEASMQYINHGFDSCQKQAEQQGFSGQLDKDSALKNAPPIKRMGSK